MELLYQKQRPLSRLHFKKIKKNKNKSIDNIFGVWYNINMINILLLQQSEDKQMNRIKTIETKDIAKTVENGGCGECQTSCQSACKTSCGVANQQCENQNK